MPKTNHGLSITPASSTLVWSLSISPFGTPLRSLHPPRSRSMRSTTPMLAFVSHGRPSRRPSPDG
ncbi:hypothetical protein BD309DRAFT_960846 [Dichomitus squalens]|nr:hypothetical protein BD309DRAFT_960846 [Dichomitus squalens]